MRLCLHLLESKTLMYAARRPLLTCVLRCHTSSPQGEDQNLISSNSVVGVYLPAWWLANPNIHQLLNPGQLLTAALPRRFSIIFLWAELSRRDPIPIVNPLLKTVRVLEGRWGTHFYFASQKNKNKTENLRNLCLI